MSRGGTTLYVTGFSHGTRARDLAYEFERSLALKSWRESARMAWLACYADKGGPNGDVSSFMFYLGHVLTTLVLVMDASSVVIFPLPDQPPADCSFAFVEYEDRRDADDAYHEMHNKRIGRDDLLKIEWARTPPSASWRFESGRDRDRRGGGRSPRRGRSPSPRRSTREYSPRKDDRRDRDRDYDRDSRRDRDRSRSPDHRSSDRERDSKDDRDDRDRRENGTNGEERKPLDSPPPAHDDLDVAE
ncbi:hypothetical protein BGZ63DRAFT_403938 [Mariannaea sp. PMI_226]|nr:hypothetical protein BGZ63DRAFT_403938 [Mariannaea sp. PMI_226]